jgi:hypothetical protein
MDERPMSIDHINALWKYKLKAEDIPSDTQVKKARRKRDRKLEEKKMEKEGKVVNEEVKDDD